MLCARPGARLQARFFVLMACALGAACSGCALVQVSSPSGCVQYRILGLAVLDLRPPPDSAVSLVRMQQLGLVLNQGAVTRAGLGYFEETWTAVDPARGAVWAEASVDAEGRQRLWVQTPNARPSPQPEAANHETPHKLDCPGLAGQSERLRQPQLGDRRDGDHHRR